MWSYINFVNLLFGNGIYKIFQTLHISYFTISHFWLIINYRGAARYFGTRGKQCRGPFLLKSFINTSLFEQVTKFLFRCLHHKFTKFVFSLLWHWIHFFFTAFKRIHAASGRIAPPPPPPPPPPPKLRHWSIIINWEWITFDWLKSKKLITDWNR